MRDWTGRGRFYADPGLGPAADASKADAGGKKKTTSTNSADNTGAIIGIVLGLLLVIILLAFGVVHYAKKSATNTAQVCCLAAHPPSLPAPHCSVLR